MRLGRRFNGNGNTAARRAASFAVDLSRRGSVVGAARRLHAIDSRTPLHLVEIKLQNALLAEHQFGHGNQRELSALAQIRTAGAEEQVFHELLGDGGTAAEAMAAFLVFFGGDLHGVPVEAVVLVEALVLGGDHGVLHIGRNLAQGNELVAQAIGLVVDPGLDAPLHVHRGGGRIDPLERH